MLGAYLIRNSHAEQIDFYCGSRNLKFSLFKIVEQFTRVAKNRVNYEITAVNSEAWEFLGVLAGARRAEANLQ